MGSPIVFHTAPPQPASNARITCAPVFDGGPDASQKGFGDSSPQSFTRKSDMLHLANNSGTTRKQLTNYSQRRPHNFIRLEFTNCRLLFAARLTEPGVHPTRRGHSFGDRIHNLFAGVGAIAAGKIFR